MGLPEQSASPPSPEPDPKPAVPPVQQSSTDGPATGATPPPAAQQPAPAQPDEPATEVHTPPTTPPQPAKQDEPATPPPATGQPDEPATDVRTPSATAQQSAQQDEPATPPVAPPAAAQHDEPATEVRTPAGTGQQPAGPQDEPVTQVSTPSGTGQHPAPQHPAPQHPAPQHPAPQHPAPQQPGPQQPVAELPEPTTMPAVPYGTGQQAAFGMPYGTGQYPVQPGFDPPTSPIRVVRTADPVAVLLGNASLLSIGYFLLRRTVFAVLSLLITITLVVLGATAVRTVWFELLIVVWWLVMIGHAALLTRRGVVRQPRPRHRLVTGVVAVVVLLVFGLLRWDAVATDQDIDDAKAAGDCPAALDAVHGIWVGDRVADSPMTVRGEQTADACHRIAQADQQFADALDTTYPAALGSGYRMLQAVLTDLPGHERMVETSLDRFLARLPLADPCDTANVLDALRNQPKVNAGPDRSEATVARLAPQALLDCGDHLMTANDPDSAKSRYLQLLNTYGSSPLVERAKAGEQRADLAIQLNTVRDAINDGSYCDSPSKYGGAPVYRKGTNKVLFQGEPGYVAVLPGAWRTDDPAKAGLVACLSTHRYGPVTQTCSYSSEGTGVIGDVTFHKIEVPVKAYALRTGKLVFNVKVEISGLSCPSRFQSPGAAYSPPPDQAVRPAKSDITSAFKFLSIR